MGCAAIDLQVGDPKGMLEFIDGSTLHFIEFVEIHDHIIERPKYKYHLQSEVNDLIMPCPCRQWHRWIALGDPLTRWDNVPHHSDVSLFPHHNHDKSGAHSSEPADL